MSNSPTADRYDAIFKALGNGTRRTILDTLRDQPLTTGALVALFPDIDRCTVMQHLNVLEAADLIRSSARVASAGSARTRKRPWECWRS